MRSGRDEGHVSSRLCPCHTDVIPSPSPPAAALFAICRLFFLIISTSGTKMTFPNEIRFSILLMSTNIQLIIACEKQAEIKVSLNDPFFLFFLLLFLVDG